MSVPDRFTGVFGKGRGAGRSEIEHAMLTGEPVAVAAALYGPGVDLRVSDVRPHVRSMPDRLLREIADGKIGGAGESMLAARICREDHRTSVAFGNNPARYRVSVNAPAFRHFLACERPSAL